MSSINVNPTTGAVSSTPPAAATSSSASSTSSSGINSLANENVFLQLLVAQLQYQDPTQPSDGTQFVTQLAEFTNVSNTTTMASDLGTMNTNLSTITNDLTPAATSGTTSGTNSGNTSGTTGTNGTTNS
jgi:flagellar basal-body rod modification protein FlgD